MGHALPDCIGITKVGEDISEYTFLAEHQDELVGARAPGGWFTSRWLDDSGAMFVLSKHQDDYYNGSAHFNGSLAARLADLDWIEDTVYVTATVLDDEGETATRLCAAFGQFPYFSELDSQATHKAVVTGLARDLTVYASAEEFDHSQSDDDRLRFGVGSFLPTGMFGGTNPMAAFAGEVEESFAYNVFDTGATVHVAQLTVVDRLPIYLCWPEYLAAVPPVGSIVRADAFLTAFMPELWADRVGV